MLLIPSALNMWYRRQSWAEGSVTALMFALLSSFMCTSCNGDTYCYECAFGPSPPPSNSACRPGNFDAKQIQQMKCPHGCQLYIIYEFEPNALVTHNVSREPSNSVIAKWVDETKDTEAITFTARRCAEKRAPKTGCMKKEYDNMHEQNCYCSTDYCNGGSTGSLPKSEKLPMALYVLGSLILSRLLTDSGGVTRILEPLNSS